MNTNDNPVKNPFFLDFTICNILLLLNNKNIFKKSLTHL